MLEEGKEARDHIASFGFHGWHAGKDNSGPIEAEVVDSMEKRAFRIIQLWDAHNHVPKRGAGHSRDMVKFCNLPTVDLPFPKCFIIEGGLATTGNAARVVRGHPEVSRRIRPNPE